MDPTIPNVRDGLTSLQRRVLYLAYSMGSCPDKPPLSVNRLAKEIVRCTPNVEIDSIYETIAILSSRHRSHYPLIEIGDTGNDFHPDSPKRKFCLSKLAIEIIDQLELVDMIEGVGAKGYEEPAFLPSRIPLLLVNGYKTTDGKWVIPPHNLAEVLDATIAKIEDPDLDSTELLDWIQGPDIPTGGTFPCFEELVSLYTSGEGTITFHGSSSADEMKISAALKALVQASDWDSKETKLDMVFTMNLARIIQLFIEHRIEIFYRYTRDRKQQALHRKHMLEGYLSGLQHSEIIIKNIAEFGSFDATKPALKRLLNLDELQLNALREVFTRPNREQELANLWERVLSDLQDKTREIRRYDELLENRKKILAEVKNQLWETKRKYSDQRKTVIVRDPFVKKSTWLHVELNKNGRGRYFGCESAVISGDIIKDFDKSETLTIFFQNLIFAFTNQGRVYSLVGDEALIQGEESQIIPIAENEWITTLLSTDEVAPTEFLYSVTANGRAQLKSICTYMSQSFRSHINIGDSDRLLTVKLASSSSTVLIATQQGRCLRFQLEALKIESQKVRDTQAITLRENDKIILVSSIASDTSKFLLLVSNDGFGKRIALDKISVQTIGRVGTLGMKLKTPKSKILFAEIVEESASTSLIIKTKNGTESCVKTSDIPVSGLSSAGLLLIDPRDLISSVAWKLEFITS